MFRCILSKRVPILLFVPNNILQSKVHICHLKTVQLRLCSGSALPPKFFENYDSNTFNRHCNVLEKSVESTGVKVSLDYLLIIPQKVSDFNLTRTQYFIEKISKNWLKSLEHYLKSAKFNREIDVFSAVYCLSLINASSKGDLVKTLGGLASLEPLLRVILHGAAKPYFTAERFSSLFKIMEEFQMYSNDLYSSEILKIAQEALLFVKNKPDFQTNVGSIICRLHYLRIEPPSEQWVKEIVELCYSSLKEYNKYNVKEKMKQRNLELLNNIGRIALGFYDLNINANRYESDFWTKFFRIFRTNFIMFENKERFATISLKFVLMLTLKFDLEEQFAASMHKFWSSNISNVQFYLKIAEKKEILYACAIKYDGDLEKIEKILTSQILDEFLRTLGDGEYELKTESDGRRVLIIDQPLSDSQSSTTTYDRSMAGKNRLNNYIDRRTYELLLKQLRTSDTNRSTAFDKSPRFLVSILQRVTTLSIVEQNEFVDRYFPILWQILEPSLFSSNSFLVAHVFHAITILNESSQGRLKRLLNADRLERLFIYVLRQAGDHNFTCSHMTELFGSIYALLLSDSNNRSLSTRFHREVANSLDSFFNEVNFNKKKYSNFYPRRIHSLLENLYLCRINAPSRNSLKTIVQCCAEFFDSNQSVVAELDKMKSILTAMRLARLFVYWRIDLDEFRSDFWKFYYNEIRLNLIEKSNFKYGHVTSDLLKTAFVSALLFNKENQFESVKYVCWSTIRNLKNLQFKRDLAESIFTAAQSTGKTDSSLKVLIKEDILKDLSTILSQNCDSAEFKNPNLAKIEK